MIWIKEKIKIGKEYRVLSIVKAFWREKRREDSSPLAYQNGGSLTVEMALVFPLFLWVILLAFYLICAVSLETRLAMGVHQAGKKLAVYAYIGKEKERGLLEGSLSAAYARRSILKTAQAEGNPLYDTSSFSAAGSDFRDSRIVDVRMTSRIRIPVPFFAKKIWKMTERARVRAWTGSVYGQVEEKNEEKHGEMVYVTETGTVYHRDRNCSHIRLSIQEVGMESVEKLRNRGGAKYYACSCYQRHPSASVYITRDGTRYHSSLSCSGLKRTVKKVELSHIGTWKSCSRCG